MKVLLINGSPNKEGSTNETLKIIEKQFKQNGIDSDIFWVGNEALSGCIGCGFCIKTKKCFIDDKVNEFLCLASDYDGFVIATPVHFSSPSGFIVSFLDRVFYGPKNKIFRLKPLATIAVGRRGGLSSSLDVLNKYGLFANMIIISSNYWNMVYGKKKDDIKKDLEGIQTIKVLADNMSYVLNLIENGNKFNIKPKKLDDKI